MSPRKRAALFAVVVILPILVLVVRRSLPDRAPPSPPMVAVTTTATAQPATTGGPTPAARPAPSAPLPPPGTAFDTIATDLAARADAGDAGAACRLSLELLRCRQLLRIGNMVSQRRHEQAGQAEALGDARGAERLLYEGDRMAAVEESCRTIPPALLERAPHWLRQAALAGDHEALMQYIDGRNLFTAMDYSYVDSPHFDLWRREAPALLQRALAAGDPQAAIWLAEGRGGGEGAIQGLLADDAGRARTWLAVVDRLYGGALPMSVPVRPAASEDQARIDETAARWHARWFDGRTASLVDKPVLELLPTADPNAMDVGTRCGAPR